MSDEIDEKLEDVQDQSIEPLEVKVVNKEVRESSPYDGHDDYEHDELKATDEEIKEFEDGES